MSRFLVHHIDQILHQNRIRCSDGSRRFTGRQVSAITDGEHIGKCFVLQGLFDDIDETIGIGERRLSQEVEGLHWRTDMQQIVLGKQPAIRETKRMLFDSL